MSKKIYKTKYISIFVTLLLIYGGLVLSIVTKDQKVSYIENKVLTQLPKFNKKDFVSGAFAKKFDKYTTEQFPGRVSWIKLKNNLEYLLGNREFNTIYVSSNGRLLQKFELNKEILFKNIEGINKLSYELEVDASLILIPTSTEIYKEDLPGYALTDCQTSTFKQIEELINIEYLPVLDILNKNKNKDIFFKTDHHWTQLGAKLAFEDIFKKDIKEEPKVASNNFYGTYFSKTLLPHIKPDTISYYEEYGDYEIDIDYNKTLNNLYDHSKLATKNQYQFFLAGDPGRAVIKGEGVGDILILKDSFAHNLIPFMAKLYNEIHIIDLRYFNLSLSDYVKEFKLNKLFFIHNIETLNSTELYKVN